MKTINLPYDEYQTDLLEARKKGFNRAIQMVAKMMGRPKNEHLSFLEDELDADAYDVAKRLGVPVPEFTEDDIPF